MELLEERYYKLNRIFLSATGLWPYDNFKFRRFRFILLLSLLISFTGSQLLKLFVSKCSINIALKILSLNIVYTIICIKYVVFYAIMDVVKETRKRISHNWNSLMDDREIEIMRKQADSVKFLMKFIIFSVYFMTIFCILSQFIPNLLDIIRPLNVSRPREQFVYAELFIDEQKYSHIITMYAGIGMVGIATAGIATETFSLTNAMYIFGLFKIASYRMSLILSGYDLRLCTNKEYIIIHNNIVAAVDMHRRAIEFSELLKESLGHSYLIMIIGLILSTSVNLFYLLLVLARKDMIEVSKYALFLIVHLIAMVLGNFAGQEFINCDTEVYRMICNMRWYNAPVKAQKLILFLIQKTTKCYKVDAGGMFSPSLESLANILSMSVSYCMVFCSL